MFKRKKKNNMLYQIDGINRVEVNRIEVDRIPINRIEVSRIKFNK